MRQQRLFPRRRPAQPKRAERTRLQVELLEDRTVPSNFTAASVSDLIADIDAANLAGGSNTITLVAGKTFTATTSNYHDNDGANAFPLIAAGDILTIVGNGDTIERSSAKGTLDFRLFDLAAGASLTLANLTLQNGLSYNGKGGAILNQGNLSLSGVTVQNNVSRDHAFGGFAAGGGIYSTGSLTLQGCTVRKNQAVGMTPTPGDFGIRGTGGLGGGLYVNGGSVSLTNVSVYSNTARGGDGADGGWVTSPEWPYDKYLVLGGDGGDGLGGGMYVAAGAASLHNTTVDHNSAIAGLGGSSTKGFPNGQNGRGEGGGLFIDVLATVYLDAFTLANAKNNSASTNYKNIFGSYILGP